MALAFLLILALANAMISPLPGMPKIASLKALQDSSDTVSWTNKGAIMPNDQQTATISNSSGVYWVLNLANWPANTALTISGDDGSLSQVLAADYNQPDSSDTDLTGAYFQAIASGFGGSLAIDACALSGMTTLYIAMLMPADGLLSNSSVTGTYTINTTTWNQTCKMMTWDGQGSLALNFTDDTTPIFVNMTLTIANGMGFQIWTNNVESVYGQTLIGYWPSTSTGEITTSFGGYGTTLWAIMPVTIWQFRFGPDLSGTGNVTLNLTNIQCGVAQNTLDCTNGSCPPVFCSGAKGLSVLQLDPVSDAFLAFAFLLFELTGLPSSCANFVFDMGCTSMFIPCGANNFSAPLCASTICSDINSCATALPGGSMNTIPFDQCIGNLTYGQSISIGGSSDSSEGSSFVNYYNFVASGSCQIIHGAASTVQVSLGVIAMLIFAVVGLV